MHSTLSWTCGVLQLLLWALYSIHAGADSPETVRFPTADGTTELVGFVWAPQAPGPHPAIVMLHGRSGAYTGAPRGTPTAETISMRHRTWGEFWASRGYVALHVDSFGPRGYPDGFPRGSYSERPPEVSEQFVRPLDAYGALAYLRSRADVAGDRIGLHGWSNGAMTVLSALGPRAPGWTRRNPAEGFRAALAQYPGCRAQMGDPQYEPSAPLLMLIAGEDDEVSPHACMRLAHALQRRGAPVEIVVYERAQHAYDDPGRRRQSHAPNRAAMLDSFARAEAFFSRHLGPARVRATP